MRIQTHLEAETERFGERLAGALGAGSVVGLSGPLGAGKTALVRGIARGLGVDEGAVHSPSFVTAAEHAGRLRLVHVDLYRHAAALPALDWLAELLDSDGVAVVEWFERLGEERPDDALWIEIAYGEGEDDRRFELRATGERSRATLAELEPRLAKEWCREDERAREGASP